MEFKDFLEAIDPDTLKAQQILSGDIQTAMARNPNTSIKQAIKKALPKMIQKGVNPAIAAKFDPDSQDKQRKVGLQTS